MLHLVGLDTVSNGIDRETLPGKSLSISWASTRQYDLTKAMLFGFPCVVFYAKDFFRSSVPIICKR